MLTIVYVLQSYCAAHASTHGRLFVPLLKKWYNDDIVTEEGILDWYKSPRSSKPSSSSAELLNLNEDGTRSKGKSEEGEEEATQVDLQALLELKKQAHDVIRFILEDSDEEEESEEESEEE
jgi:translation initiation factor eIF-2B subunit epsilon